MRSYFPEVDKKMIHSCDLLKHEDCVKLAKDAKKHAQSAYTEIRVTDQQVGKNTGSLWCFYYAQELLIGALICFTIKSEESFDNMRTALADLLLSDELKKAYFQTRPKKVEK